MKKNRVILLVVLVLALAIITAIIISGAFARYTTQVDGTSTEINVAKWHFGVENFGSVQRTDGIGVDKIVAGKLAPGTKGKFNVVLDFTGCEVGVDYSVIISNIQNKPTNLKFYSDEQLTKELTLEEGKYKITNTISQETIAATTPLNETVNIYWQWPYDTDPDSTEDDKTDTAEGESAQKMTFDVSAVATQADPNK